jgi:hypothetical protein
LFVSFAAPWAIAGLADRFALIIDGLCRAAAARLGAPGPARWTAGPLMILLWGRLRRMAARFAALAARAGVRRRAFLRPGTVSSPPLRPRTTPKCLPRRFAWLVRLVPEAACYGTQLQHLLSEPAMAELLAASPQARRILRPLCRMLGVLQAPAQPASPLRAETEAETPGPAKRSGPGAGRAPRLPALSSHTARLALAAG